MRVLFTGGRSPATLALLRLFAQAGHSCQVAESLAFNLTGASRYCQYNHLVPPPRQETAAFIGQLQSLIQSHQIDLLIPTCEESFYVARHKRALESAGARVFTPPSDVMTNLHSKAQFIQMLPALKIPAPRSERLTDREQLKRRLREFPQYVLKAEFSRFASSVLINAPVQQVYQEVHPSPEQPWILQEYLPGQQFCSYSVAFNGKLRAHSVYPTRFTMGQGATIYFESVEIPEIENSVRKIVESLNYTGQISFDFIGRDNEGTVEYLPIECNPRTTTGTFLFGPNDNLPSAFTPAQDGTLIRPQPKAPVSMSQAMLIYALPKAPIQTLKAMWRGKDPLLQLDDFSPFLRQFPMLYQTWRWARKAQTSMLAASTLDIEWNGRWD